MVNTLFRRHKVCGYIVRFEIMRYFADIKSAVTFSLSSKEISKEMHDEEISKDSILKLNPSEVILL